MMMTLPDNPRELNLPHNSWRVGQKETAEWCMSLDGVGLVEAPTGCHRAGTEIMLYDGTAEKVENILIGDRLKGPDNWPRVVGKLIHGSGPMYKVEPVKGQPFIVNLDHVLTLVRTATGKDKQENTVVDVSVREYLSWAKSKKHLYKLFRPSCCYFPINPQPLQVDPYLLGVLLGDGMLKKHGVAITTMDPEIVTEIYRWANLWQMKVRVMEGNSGKAKTYVYNKPHGGEGRTYLAVCLERLDLMGKHAEDKFIPHCYKTAEIQDRRELLAGLMDTDGHLSRGSCFDYVSKSSTLAQDVAFVCRSIGLAAYVSETRKGSQNGTVGTYYRVSISGDVSQIPCRTPRRQAKPRKQKKDVTRTGFKVSKVSDDEEFYGFTLDRDGRYLMGDFIVTHNSGKTSFAATCAYDYPTTTLCRTKNLQQENYGDTYGFDVLFGRGNYRCIHPDNPHPDATCAECIFIEQGSNGRGMSDCPLSQRCLYLNQKALVMGSRRASLNYAYWLSAVGMRSRPRDYLFLDECHQLSDLVLEWAGVTINEAERVKWGLPRFPLANSRARVTSSLVQVDEDVSLNEIEGWLVRSIDTLSLSMSRMGRITTPKEQKQSTDLENLKRKLESTLEALEYGPDDWFVQSGPMALTWGGEKRPGMLVKPLTARFHYPRFFPSGNGSEVDDVLPRCVLMSATVGDFDTFAAELGISSFTSRRVPSQWAPERRPVFTLDVPKLNYKSEDKDYEHQAEAIAQAILTVPRDWCGIIHVTRKREAPLLAERLARRGLQDRVWVPGETDSTNWAAQKWEERKERVPGSLMISWQFWEGFDGRDEQICCVAKIPYPYLGDPYETARQRRSGSFYLQRTAWALMQGLGRTRRGREQDYDTEDERRGLCLIADASWSKLGGFGKGKRYLSEDFVEAIREWHS